jgi:hypothetical protein
MLREENPIGAKPLLLENVFAMFRLCKAILPQMKEGALLTLRQSSPSIPVRFS